MLFRSYEAGKLLRNLKLKARTRMRPSRLTTICANALQWWYFLDHPEIPPDNNLAERALRLAVTKRKISGGSRSMARFEDTAYNLSAIQTCRFQRRSVVDFFAAEGGQPQALPFQGRERLTSALQAHAGVGEQPSLIPDT